MDAAISLLGSIATIVTLSIAVSAGSISLMLSAGPHLRAIPIVSAAFLPTALVVFLSRFGHLGAKDITVSDWKFIAGVGIVLSVVLAAKNLGKIRQLVFARITLLSLFSGLASLIPFVFLNCTEPFSYNYLGNGEFLNYAALASAMINKDATMTDVLLQHQSLRYGQDIFLCVVSESFGKNPVEMVHVASGYLLFCYGAVAGLIITTVFRSTFLVVLLVLINSAMLLPLFNFSASFFSSTVILSSSLLVLAYSTSRIAWSKCQHTGEMKVALQHIAGEVGLLTMFFSFVMIAYPEFGVPIVIVSLVLAIYQSFCLHFPSRSLIALALACIAATTINYCTIANGVGGFISQYGTSGGWNIFGDPRVDFGRFLLNITGLSFALATHHVAEAAYAKYLVIFGGLGTILLALRQPRSGKTDGVLSALLLFLALAMYTLGAPFFTGKHWYPAVKLFSQFSIVIVLIVGLAFSEAVGNQKMTIKWSSRLVLCSLYCVYIVVGVQEILLARKEMETFNFAAWSKAVSSSSNNLLPLIVFKEHEGEVLWFAEHVARENGFNLLPISISQVDRLARKASSLPPSCRLRNNKLPAYEFSALPDLSGELLAVVGADDPYNRIISDQGFSIPVSTQETISRFGNFRLDRIVIDFGVPIAFDHDSWSINGVWSACINSKNLMVTVGFNVPDSILVTGPIDITLKYSGSTSSMHVSNSGPYAITVESEMGTGSPQLILLSSSRSWVPMQVDPNSFDKRRLGVNITTLTMR